MSKDWRVGLKCLDCEKVLTKEDVEAGKCLECGSSLREPGVGCLGKVTVDLTALFFRQPTR